ncbi:hypothetical protein OXYTRIMIC_582 [Oxytricha trifallax]|uniref:Uncharacterized protein n=1 Tax=Oxytricha trifallax TaxID=1172189 RepID=A0A073HX93_9SPIT|nr:hypothetical protein OXYTRIMIC_582 [Oxytricha trifallax]
MYFLTFNLEVGHMKLQIGKSGVTIYAEETEQVAEKRNEDIWKLANEEKGTEKTYMKSHVDTWDEWVLENGNKGTGRPTRRPRQLFQRCRGSHRTSRKLLLLSAEKRKRMK